MPMPRGFKFSEESKLKMSLSRKGKSLPHTEEWNRNLGNAIRAKVAANEWHTPVNPNPRGSKTGRAAANRGIGTRYAEPFYERLRRGLPIACVTHGEHMEWYVQPNKKNSITCRKCRNEAKFRWNKKNEIVILVKACKKNDPHSELTVDFLKELREKQNNVCALTGDRFDYGDNRADGQQRMPVDRIDSSRPHECSNVQLTTWPVNKMKSDFPLDEFIELCQKVTQYNAPEYGMSGC